MEDEATLPSSSVFVRGVSTTTLPPPVSQMDELPTSCEETPVLTDAGREQEDLGQTVRASHSSGAAVLQATPALAKPSAPPPPPPPPPRSEPSETVTSLDWEGGLAMHASDPTPAPAPTPTADPTAQAFDEQPVCSSTRLQEEQMSLDSMIRKGEAQLGIAHQQPVTHPGAPSPAAPPPAADALPTPALPPAADIISAGPEDGAAAGRATSHRAPSANSTAKPRAQLRRLQRGANGESKPKKPFLKRGSRVEPTALARYKKEGREPGAPRPNTKTSEGKAAANTAASTKPAAGAAAPSRRGGPAGPGAGRRPNDVTASSSAPGPAPASRPSAPSSGGSDGALTHATSVPEHHVQWGDEAVGGAQDGWAELLPPKGATHAPQHQDQHQPSLEAWDDVLLPNGVEHGLPPVAAATVPLRPVAPPTSLIDDSMLSHGDIGEGSFRDPSQLDPGLVDEPRPSSDPQWERRRQAEAQAVADFEALERSLWTGVSISAAPAAEPTAGRPKEPLGSYRDNGGPTQLDPFEDLVVGESVRGMDPDPDSWADPTTLESEIGPGDEDEAPLEQEFVGWDGTKRLGHQSGAQHVTARPTDASGARYAPRPAEAEHGAAPLPGASSAGNGYMDPSHGDDRGHHAATIDPPQPDEPHHLHHHYHHQEQQQQHGHMATTPPGPPPTSELVRRVFQSRNPHQQHQHQGKSSAGRASKQQEQALDEKMVELEQALAKCRAEQQHFKDERNGVRRVKAQQDRLIAEMRQKREEVTAWAVEERAAVERWCAQQRAQVAKERRLLQRQQQGGEEGPSRKERAEIAALTSTIEKMRQDETQLKKRSRASEQRLRSQLKDQLKRTHDLEAQVAALEGQLNDLRAKVPKVIAQEREKERQRLAQRQAEDAQLQQQQHWFGLPTSPPRERSEAQLSLRQRQQERQKHWEQEQQRQRLDALVPDREEGSLGPTYDPSRYHTADDSALPFQENPARYQRASHHVPPRAEVPSSAPPVSTGRPAATDVPELVERYPIPPAAASDVLGAPAALQPPLPAPTSSAFEPAPSAGAARRPAYIGGAGRGSRTRSSAGSLAGSSGEGLAQRMSGERFERKFPDGRTVVWYSNGTHKEKLPDGTATVSFTNGDIKKTTPDGVVTYFYAAAKTTHSTYPHGVEVFEFPSKQIERHFPDGTKEINFPDGTRKIIRASGVHESRFPDGVELFEFPDGHREVVSPDGTRQREEPDGTVSVVNQ